MGKPLTADDVLPIVAALTPQERTRLLRLISAPGDEAAATAYVATPTTRDETGSDDDALAWDSDGWENLG